MSIPISLSVQLITVSIISLQRQIAHNYYSNGPQPVNGTRYDYIVVGAGTAGCVVAARLAENSSLNILLIEAGGPQSVITDMPGNTLFLVGGEFDWNYNVVPQTSAGLAYPNFFISRGKVLGGSSVTQWDIYNRGNRRDYDNWAQTYNLTDWSYNDVLPYFLKSENNTDRNIINSNGGYHRTGGPVSVSTENIPDPIILNYRDAANSIGIQTVDLNGEQQFGTAIAQMFWNNDTAIKSTTANTYIENNNRTNLHVLTHSTVIEILLDRTANQPTAYGVVYKDKNGAIITVYANREVIISAGPINSPQILMLSGIGPRSHLELLNIPVIVDLPVGDNLHDHVMVPLYYKIDGNSLIDPLPYFNTENLYNYYTNSSGPLAHHPDGVTYINSRYNMRNRSWPDSMIITVVEYFGDNLNATVSQYVDNKSEWTDYWRPYVGGLYLAIDPVLVKPRSRGTVRLNASNPLGPPLVDPRYLTDAQDFEIMLDAVRIAIYIALKDPLNFRVFPPIPGCTLCEDIHLCDSYLRCHVRQLARSYFNFVGTCRMGNSSDNNIVVDNRLRVKGVSNLRVIDASVIPQIPNSHTNAATIMIAERGSDFIKNGR